MVLMLRMVVVSILVVVIRIMWVWRMSSRVRPVVASRVLIVICTGSNGGRIKLPRVLTVI